MAHCDVSLRGPGVNISPLSQGCLSVTPQHCCTTGISGLLPSRGFYSQKGSFQLPYSANKTYVLRGAGAQTTPHSCPSCLLAAAAMVQVQDKRTAVPLGHGMRDTEMSTQVQLGRRHRSWVEGGCYRATTRHIARNGGRGARGPPHPGRPRKRWLGFKCYTEGSPRKHSPFLLRELLRLQRRPALISAWDPQDCFQITRRQETAPE